MKKIKLFIQKYRRNIIIVVTVLLAVLGLTNLYFSLEVTPVSNDECLWVEKRVSADSVFIFFEKVKNEGVAWNAGIRNGDRLVAIGDVRLPNNIVASVTLNRYKAGQYARYTVSRDGKEFQTTVYVKKLINFSTLGFNLLGIIWLIVGFVVIMAKPDGYVQRLFYRVGALFVLTFTLSLLPGFSLQELRMERYIIAAIVDFVWTLSAFLLAFAIVFLFWNFPKPFRLVEKKWIRKAFLIVPLGLFVISYIYRVYFVYLRRDPSNFKIVILAINVLLTAGLITGLVSLLINYRRMKTRSEKKPVFIILVAYILGVGSLIYTVTIANVIADTIFNTPEYFMPIILVAVIPVSFGYSIFKYQLMDVSIVVKNTIIYGTATITIAAIYFLTVYGIGQGIGEAVGTEYRNGIAAVAFVVFALVFQSTKNRFQEVLTKKFYPEQFAYQKVILKFGSDVVSIVGLENILDSMKTTFVNSLNLKHFAILLNEDAPHVFQLKRETGTLQAGNLTICDNDLRLTHYIRQQLVLQMPVTVDRQQFQELFPEDCEKLIAAQIYTIIPMIMKAKLIGLLAFGLKHSGSQFAGKDLELLCAAANQAAVSIENARLYQSEAQRLTLERDLENARRIQENLLPKAIPQLKGIDISGRMIPAMQVGGDYYDFIRVSPHRIFVVVGDVSGKGLSASLYMSKLQTMMRLYCTEGRTPREILIDINKKIYESIERNWFITATLALFDTSERTVRFCRAGHSQLLDICNNSVKLYQPKGIGLGLEEGKIFMDTLEEMELPFEPGHIYAIYSDGISEAMNEDNEMFGADELANVIIRNNRNSAHEIMSSVFDSIIEFRGRREQNDDITLVLVKSGDV
ncbi:MAG: SpoIIE family protein phosphatase [Ignavibacteriales bacterium]